jgi:hypothetical protein
MAGEVDNAIEKVLKDFNIQTLKEEQREVLMLC